MQNTLVNLMTLNINTLTLVNCLQEMPIAVVIIKCPGFDKGNKIKLKL